MLYVICGIFGRRLVRLACFAFARLRQWVFANTSSLARDAVFADCVG